MRDIELLAPAGSFEALRAAVQNGCDAVYLGGTCFGARAFANNFNDEEMKRAVAYAHVYGVRVFVTVNTLIKEHEIKDCIAYVKKLQQMDVDALILQDMGMFTLLHKHFPDMELHASTQMHIHNPQGITMLKEMGAARVVVPRETSIEEIREYSRLGVDLEVFVQGALCISYSGQCLMSALTLNRSGNRGECAQSCRMQYELEKTDENGRHILKADGSYLLSPKDLNTLEYVPSLIEAGIASFKIEGRMKRPEYVALMVSCYRKAIDAYKEGRAFHVDEVMKEEMQKIFHRGFSAGHLFHQTGSALMNFYRPNHMGITIGSIEAFTKDKVRIKLTKELQQGDGIRILSTRNDEGFCVNRIYKNGLLVNHGEAGDLIELDKTFYAEKGSLVVKSSDVKQLKKLQESYAHLARKVDIFGIFHMQPHEPAILEIMDNDGFHTRINSDMPCDIARTTPLSQERIDIQLRKTKDTPFTFKEIEYDVCMNGILPVKEINRMRREALNTLAHMREVRNGNRRFITTVNSDVCETMPELDELIVVVHNEEQYAACREAGISMIYIAEHALYETHKNEVCVYERTPRVMKDTYPDEMIMIQEAGGLAAQQPVLCDTSCNVTNIHTAAMMFSRHAAGVTLSLESSLEECLAITEDYHDTYGIWGNFIYPIYGREELMLSEYCVINAVEKDNGKKHCGLCRQGSYALLDRSQRRYPILTDHACRMHILNAEPRNRISDMKEAKHHHLTSFLCVFTDETHEECKMILSAVKKELS